MSKWDELFLFSQVACITMFRVIDPIVLLTESGCSLLIITENRIMIDIKTNILHKNKINTE